MIKYFHLLNRTEQQKSIECVETLIGCEANVCDAIKPTGQTYTYMVFDFKKFIQKFVQSMDPEFNTNDIEEAYYRTNEYFGEAFIFLKSPEAALQIQIKIHKLKVSDIFPGNSSK